MLVHFLLLEPLSIDRKSEVYPMSITLWGSIELGTLLCNIYLKPLSEIICHHRLK